MELNHPKASKLWEYINDTHLRVDKQKGLKGFKSSSINHKLAIWNPEANGVRYLKALIFYICSTLSPQQWNKLDKIYNREVGNPYSIRFNNKCVCLDYLQAVFEIGFMENYFDFNNSNIMEIGAGYGRTCHALLSNFDISNYFIIDLKNSLELSKCYLKIVLDKAKYNKITFINVDSFKTVSKQNFNLCINIDSLAEMEENTAQLYLNFINRQCENFYVKNPVGKYCDKSLCSQNEGREVINMAMETGILKKIIDIHDNMEVEKQSRNFVKAYCPSNNWECIENEWAKPWSFYWQAFYKKI